MTAHGKTRFSERESEFAAERSATLGAERADAVTALEAEFAELFARVRRTYLDGAERIAPGLSPGAYKLFGVIARRGPVTPSDLAERTLSDRSQVSRLVRELESHELIERTPDPRDGRSFLLSATAHGADRLHEARRRDATRTMQALSQWKIDDIHQLTHLLGALSQAMSPDDEKTAPPSCGDPGAHPSADPAA